MHNNYRVTQTSDILIVKSTTNFSLARVSSRRTSWAYVGAWQNTVGELLIYDFSRLKVIFIVRAVTLSFCFLMQAWHSTESVDSVRAYMEVKQKGIWSAVNFGVNWVPGEFSTIPSLHSRVAQFSFRVEKAKSPHVLIKLHRSGSSRAVSGAETGIKRKSQRSNPVLCVRGKI